MCTTLLSFFVEQDSESVQIIVYHADKNDMHGHRTHSMPKLYWLHVVGVNPLSGCDTGTLRVENHSSGVL